jgi:probable HAF family extracellular repeat protein
MRRLPGDVISEAFDITNDGTIVGQSCSPDFQCRAALWSNGNVIDLNQALSPPRAGRSPTLKPSTLVDRSPEAASSTASSTPSS